MNQVEQYIHDAHCYAVSYETMFRKFGRSWIDQLPRYGCYTFFQFDGALYVGTEQSYVEYYQDKLNGTNPFYQTS
jgi:hypothetical protein